MAEASQGCKIDCRPRRFQILGASMDYGRAVGRLGCIRQQIAAGAPHGADLRHFEKMGAIPAASVAAVCSSRCADRGGKRASRIRELR